MDRITSSLVKEFLSTQEMKTSGDAVDFENFANYAIVANEYHKTFDVFNVTIGAGDDTGIDGLAILVNGHLVEDKNEIDELEKINGSLDVTYIFIQAKTSTSFSSAEMRTFYHGVTDFFSEDPRLRRNADVKKFAEISDYLLSKAANFKSNPVCKAFFVTTGKFREDQNLLAVINKAQIELEDYNLFSRIDLIPIGADDLAKLYRKTINPISRTFTFSNKVSLPSIDGIDQSYFGVVPFSEFKKLIMDDNDSLFNVFDDNVRDFQGESNQVNKKIAETLGGDNPNLFSVLNNGVTIVANKLKTSVNSFSVEDYQIVNGCQTSNVLYEHRHLAALDGVDIPVRLIVTTDDDVKSEITISTNSQTAIKKEQLTSMTDFQRKLEAYYKTIKGDGQLYYERRAKQYNSDKSVVKRRVITIANQIKSFSSIFYKNPHIVTTYFGSLVTKIRDEKAGIFEEDHACSPYYLAGLAYYRLDSLFSSGEVDKKYRKVKFYLIMLVPMLTSKDNIPQLNSYKKIDQYCDAIIKKLNDDAACKEVFRLAVKIVENSGVDVEDKQALKSQGMTNDILKAYNGEKVSGMVVS
ncbi:AIPR protein [Rubritalea squalenifaciens DSM 18772]|uniref:AIPR protein n=1 Tax=Rubritalea squalenifaciens DSM 18772 TaxID=1123071 RepID=A0A1M6H4F7_9BACT|nr:AIPR family protein [Rubritalea squalenifaciens]SHJ17026.1 AIPR protein [Rubritalea squalenifaciens DSM 18772]